MNTLFSRPDRLHSPLYVITTIFDSPRFRARWKLYEDFARMVSLQPDAVLYTVEVAFGRRDFAVTQADNPHHLQLRTDSEIWLKENALNLGIQRLPRDWQYVAWVDADVHFARYDWADETRHRLQHYPLVQMWTECHDLDPNHELIALHRSFVDCHHRKLPRVISGSERQPDTHYYYQPPTSPMGPKIVYWHPGFAWAARREAIDALGGLMDYCVLGSADYHMANALIGTADRTIRQDYHPRYKQLILDWEQRALREIKYNIGCVPGSILHYWHGPKSARQYNTRGQIIVGHQFNPDIDLRRDWQGLWTLTDRSYGLRDDLRDYFHARNDDDIHLPPAEAAAQSAIWENWSPAGG